MQKTKCLKCKHRRFAPLTDDAVFRHLSGKDALCRDVLGIYPMLPNETTNFIVIDFDDGDWQMDISAVRTVCKDHGISCAVERSRSGEAYFISGKLNMLMRAVNQCMMNGANVIVITKKADNAYAEKMRQMMAAYDIEHYIKKISKAVSL